MSEQEPSMRVTLRDVYDAVNALTDVVSEMKTELGRQADREEAAAEVRRDHEARLRSLERRVWALPSVAGVLSIVSVALAVLQWVSK